MVSVQDSGDVAAGLRDLACRQLALVIQQRILQLRRLVIGEVARFPELRRTFYDQGPGRTLAALAATFERLAARGLLQLDDPKCSPSSVTTASRSASDTRRSGRAP